MKEKIMNSLTSNLSLRLLSIALAFCLWMLVINTDDPITTRTFSNVDVTIINNEVLENLNQTYQITEGDSISFSIKGKKTIVDKMKKTDFIVTADLSELSSVNAVPIKIQAKRFAEDIEIIYGNDKTLKLTIEDLQQAQVPVTVDAVGNPAKGFMVGEKTSYPNLINIKGPVSIIRQIKQVKATVNVDQLSSDIVTHVTPLCYDEEGNHIDSDRIYMDQQKIKVKISMWRTKKVDLQVRTTGDPEPGYTVGTIDYEPRTVLVTGKKADLARISEIELPAIDIEGRRSSVEESINLDLLTLPEGISLANDEKEIMVKVNIDKSMEKDLYISAHDIQIQNRNQDYDAEFLEDGVTIHLAGLSSSVERATAETLQPRVVLDQVSVGEQKITIVMEELSNVRVQGEAKIKILIRRKDSGSVDEDTDTEEE